MAFSQKIALITGAGGGIGLATVKLLAREGARVIAADVSKSTAQAAINCLPNSNDHLALELNVANCSSVVNCFGDILKHFNKSPSLLVQSAGITRDDFLHKLEEEQFMDVINVNLKGTYLVQKEFVKNLQDEDGSSAAIVNISSIVAKHGNMGQCNYAASKAGVEAFTKSSAKELGKTGVRVNCVVPGFIETKMVESVPDHLKSMLLFATPLKRMGKPEEVAEVIGFLLSDRSSYMTGALVEVTGGLSM